MAWAVLAVLSSFPGGGDVQKWEMFSRKGNGKSPLFLLVEASSAWGCETKMANKRRLNICYLNMITSVNRITPHSII